MDKEIIKKSRKEINKEKVKECALTYFIKYGIEGSKVKDIAKDVGLTERSAFRYFETKSELVLETALLFWNKKVDEIKSECIKDEILKENGITQVRYIINKYVDLFFTSSDELLFVDEAETYLNRCGKILLIKNRPPMNFQNSNGPLANAIRVGVKDKTIKNNEDLPLLYLNTYDSLLGLMQKLALIKDENNEQEMRARLNLFIDSLINMYRN